MGKYISLGEYNKYLIFTYLTVAFNILTYFIFGYDLNNSFVILKLKPTFTQLKLYNHSNIHDIFKYTALFIISWGLCIYEDYSLKRSTKFVSSSINERSISVSTIKLLQYDPERDFERNISTFKVLLIIFLLIFQNYLIDLFFKGGYGEIDYWVLELLILGYFNKKFFNIKLYDHQYCAIYFNLIFCTAFKILSFFISLNFGEEEDNKNIYINHGIYIQIGIMLYLFNITLKLYCISQIKMFIDSKYISPTKIMRTAGFLGIIFFSIICTIESFIKCPNLDLVEHMCRVSNENSNSTYIDKYSIYFKILKGDIFKDNYSDKELTIEILVIIFGTISFVLYIYFFMAILNHLKAEHYIFTNPIFNFFFQIILLINNKVRTGYFFKGKDEFTDLKFFKFTMDISGTIVSLFGFVVYLEYIELNFWGLNYNLRKNIKKRGEDDKEGIKEVHEFELEMKY